MCASGGASLALSSDKIRRFSRTPSTFSGCTPEMSMDLDLDFFGQDLSIFAGFGSELDLRSWQVPDLDLQIF